MRVVAEQGLPELIELAASQATKTDHTEAEVLAEAERLRADKKARLAREAAARTAEEAARRKAEEDEAAGPYNFILQKEATLAEQEVKPPSWRRRMRRSAPRRRPSSRRRRRIRRRLRSFRRSKRPPP